MSKPQNVRQDDEDGDKEELPEDKRAASQQNSDQDDDDSNGYDSLDDFIEYDEIPEEDLPAVTVVPSKRTHTSSTNNTDNSDSNAFNALMADRRTLLFKRKHFKYQRERVVSDSTAYRRRKKRAELKRASLRNERVASSPVRDLSAKDTEEISASVEVDTDMAVQAAVQRALAEKEERERQERLEEVRRRQRTVKIQKPKVHTAVAKGKKIQARLTF